MKMVNTKVQVDSYGDNIFTIKQVLKNVYKNI